MTTKLGLRLLAGMLVSTVVCGAWAQDLDDVEKRIVAAWKNHKSMTAKMDSLTQIDFGVMSVNSKASGTIEAQREGDTFKSRMELSVTNTRKMGEDEETVEQKALTVVDGEFVWSLMEMGDQKQAMKAKATEQSAPDPARMLAGLRGEFELKVLPDENIDGRDAWVIEATPKAEGGMPIVRMVQYFWKEHGVLLKSVGYNAEGKTTNTITFSDYKFDEKIDPARFTFTVPEGVTLIDQTTAAPEGIPMPPVAPSTPSNEEPAKP
jgi:outer membrane lipoprotein-sorting protein